MATESTPWIIRETGVPDALELRLVGDDLPHGFPREQAVLESGGQTRLGDQEGTYIPGRKAPIFHVLNDKQRPIVLKGAFRDSLAAQRLDNAVRHARDMRDLCERIRRRANLVEVIWGDDTRICFFDDGKYGEESEFDITYELHLLVAVGPQGTAPTQSSTSAPTRSSAADIAAQMQQDIAAQQAAMAQLALQSAFKTNVLQQVNDLAGAIDVASAAANDLEALSVGNGLAVATAVRRVIAAAQIALAKKTTLAATLAVTHANDAMVFATADATTAWQSVAFSLGDLLNAIADQLRSMRAQALQRLGVTTKLYRVQATDTLESIAQTQLGSRMRVNDLGIAASDLVPGRYVRIPLGG